MPTFKNRPGLWPGTVLVLAITVWSFFATDAYAKAVDEAQVYVYAADVQAGHREALRTVLALPTAGASAEAQDIVAGKAIEPYPRLFLTQLKHSQFADCTACLNGLVGNLGSNFVDKPALQLKVLRRRKAALLGVRDDGLQKVRDKCVATLDSQIRTLEHIISIRPDPVKP